MEGGGLFLGSPPGTGTGGGPPGPPGSPGAPGSPGSNGSNGSNFLTGHGAPGGGVGANGDTYEDLDTGLLYGPKTAGAWGSGFPLLGASLSNTVPPDASIPNGGAREYWKDSLQQVWVKGKDSIGTVYNRAISGSGSTAGLAIAVDQIIFSSNYDLASSIYTRGSFIDFPSAAAGTGSPLQISFVAPCDQVRLEVILPPLFVSNAPTNFSYPIQFSVTIPGGAEQIRLNGPSLPAVQYFAQGEVQRSEVINVTVGATYTYKLQINVPTATGTAPTYSMGYPPFGQTFATQKMILRATGAS